MAVRLAKDAAARNRVVMVERHSEPEMTLPPGIGEGPLSAEPSDPPRSANANRVTPVRGRGKPSESSSPGDAETVEWSADGIAEVNASGVDAGVTAILNPTPFKPPTTIGDLPQRHVRRPGSTGPVHDDADYRIVGELGRGGTAIVYQAHQRAVNREVALKFLRDDLPEPAVSRKRFLDEARVIGSMDHPNVIAIHEVCLDQSDRLFYVMKRVDGVPWDQRIGDMTESENIDTLLRVADAIRYAHSRRWIHRDIKPENVMLGQFGEVLLADWGLAIAADEAGSALRSQTAIGGTPAYMPPELALGHGDRVDVRTDVYLLGAILYRIVTGKPPHAGETLTECIRAAADNLIQPTDVDSELVTIAREAMNTSAEDRFASVEDFIGAIRNERAHSQSERLVRRAKKRLHDSASDGSLEFFSFVDSLLAEALDLWPGNAAAIQTRRDLQVSQAGEAARRGDFDLAITLFEAAGQANSEAAVRVRRRRDEAKLQAESVSKYSALFVRSPDAGLLVQFPTGRIVEANDKFGRMFGYDKLDVVDQSISELNLWVCPRQRESLVKRLRNEDHVDDFETRLSRRDGTTLDVVIASQRIRIDGEGLMLSTIRDISERKRAERELLESERRLRNLQRMAELATWRYRIADNTIHWSDALFQMFGRDPSDGTPTREAFYEMVHPGDRQRLRDVVDLSIRSGTAYSIRIRQRSPRGGYQKVLIRGEPIYDAEQSLVEIYGVSMPEVGSTATMDKP